MAERGTSRGYVSTNEAAGYCGVDRRTVLRWVDGGLLPSFQTGGGRNRIRTADLVAFMKDRGMPIPPDLEAPAPRPDSGPRRVLVVDDDPNHVAAMRRLIAFRHPETEVQAATDGFTAGLVVKAFRPHLLFLDIVMPGLDGVEVCRRIRGESDLADVRIAIVSGALTPALEASLRGMGADHFMRKPVDPVALESLLALYLEGAEPMKQVNG